MDDQLDELAARISRWRRETILYRYLNVVLFLATKILVPTLAAVIAANLSLSITGNSFVSSGYMIALGIAVTVLSGLDTFINPREKKRVAFQTNNRLAALDEKLRREYVNSEGKDQKFAVLEAVSNEIRTILDDYAARGW